MSTMMGSRNTVWLSNIYTMAKFKNIVLLAALIGFPYRPSCASEIPKDLLITLKRTTCFGKCPSYTLRISHDGAIEFDGLKYVKPIGISRDQMSEADLKDLLYRIESHDFFSLRPQYRDFSDGCHEFSTDEPTIITSITLNGRSKRVARYEGCIGAAPDWLEALENSIDSHAKVNRWTDHP